MGETITTTEKRETETIASDDNVRTQETVSTVVKSPVPAEQSPADADDEYHDDLAHVFTTLHDDVMMLAEKVMTLEQKIEQPPAPVAPVASPPAEPAPAPATPPAPAVEPAPAAPSAPATETVIVPTPDVTPARKIRRHAGIFW